MSATLALSVSGITIRAAMIAGLAIVALLLTGWRKPARAEPGSPRGAVRRSGPVDPYATGFLVDHLDTAADHRPGLVRRVLALVASSGIGILMGVLTAIVLSFAVAWSVIWLTNLLER